MADVILNFPRGFLWGSTSSSHQVEGNNINNNWFTWEKSGNISHRHVSDTACDWWAGRWREDLDRAVETRQNAFRLSVEWSRIQPNPNRWNEDALDHYRQIMQGLHERGLTPMVTLHHFSEPMWFSELGGWQNEAAISYFSNFASKTVEALQEYVTLWCTLNEPSKYALQAYLLGNFPPGNRNFFGVYRVMMNLIKGHAAAYRAIHEVQSSAKVGIAHHFSGFYAKNHMSPFDRLAASILHKTVNTALPQTIMDGVFRFLGTRKHIKEAKGTQDYLGLSYLTSKYVSLKLFDWDNSFINFTFPNELDLSPSKSIANEPNVFFEALKWAKRYKLPIIITENGTEDPGDDFRKRYLFEHIYKLWQAVNFNWKIQGYFHKSLVDTFEWDHGWSRPFGMWGLDRTTQERHKKDSAYLYTSICRENALTSDMAKKYSPELFDKLFPT